MESHSAGPVSFLWPTPYIYSELLQLVTTSNFNSLTDLYILQITTANETTIFKFTVNSQKIECTLYLRRDARIWLQP
jgi:hypothetical protein